MALQRLGPFELLRVVGRGGMGTVYEAREVGAEERVAVKALSPVYSFDEKFRNRFEAEIDALMSLDHENIVRLLSYGQDEGNMFFAMELVDGVSLFQEQKKGQVFHWEEIIDIAIQVCEGLRHAHNRGIIHRDLKPGNLMIDKERHVKITDFGIAKSFGSSSLTGEGNVLGTMDFMSPEQARGKATNAKTDLFSLGAVMYSLLAGKPPFLHKTVEQTFEALLSAAPPKSLNRIAPDIPKPLCELIHRLMEKDTALRIATAQATGRQLAHVRDIVKNAPPPDMDTQVVDSKVMNFGNTQVVTQGATGEREFSDTRYRDSKNQKTAIVGPAPGETAETSLPTGKQSSRGKKEDSTDSFQKRQPDYFNEVTPQQRQKKLAYETVQDQNSSIWPLLLALTVVVGLCGGGIWLAVFQKPSAESLLATIEEHESYPIKAMDEIRSYLKHYPEEAETPYVQNLFEFAGVLKYRNSLRARNRASLKNPLSLVEEQFLEFASLKPVDAPRAQKLLNSFLVVYTGNENLTADDSRAVEMARRLQPIISRSAEQHTNVTLGYLNNSLAKARDTQDDSTAIEIYESILERFSDVDWSDEISELLKQTQLELDERKSIQEDQ